MEIFYKFGRFWTALCPLAILVLMFKYAYQLNSILKQIEGISFKKTLVVLFIAFFALWSLLHQSSLLFVRIVSWIWKGKGPTPTEKPSFRTKKVLEEPFKNNMDYHTAREEENLFKLDLQGDSADSLAEEN